MTLVNLAELTAALAERDAARAEVARLRAAVEGDTLRLTIRMAALLVFDEIGRLDNALATAIGAKGAIHVRHLLTATEDQP